MRAALAFALALACALALALAVPAQRLRAGPVVLWSNTDSLADVNGQAAAVTARQLRDAVELAVRRHDGGDVVVLADQSSVAPQMARLLQTDNAAAAALKSVVNSARTRATLANVDASGALIAQQLVQFLAAASPASEVVRVDAAADLQTLTRSAARPRVFVVDVPAVGGLDAALEALQSAFGADTAPFVAVYAGDAPVGKIAAAGRTTRAVADDRTKGVFEKYSFFNPAIWMGLLTVVVLLVVAIVGFNGLSSLQTPTQFEKKPLSS